MEYLRSLALLTLAGSSLAFPFPQLLRPSKRLVENQLNDVDILRYALALEHLEDKFYREDLANFTQSEFAAAGFDSTFYANIQTISAHETAHVQFLSAALLALGEKPIEECTYAFGITTVAQFAATAAIFEGIGTSAYLGAAPQVSSKQVLAAAGSILSVEARHNAYLRASLSQSPFPQNQDDPLTPDEMYTLAHGFIVLCPSDNPTFPVKAFPGLSVTTTGMISSGQVVGVQIDDYVLVPHDKQAHLFAAFVMANGADWALLTPSGDGMNFQVTVPASVNGQSYLLLNDCNTTGTDQTVVAGPTLLEITNNPLNYTSA